MARRPALTKRKRERNGERERERDTERAKTKEIKAANKQVNLQFSDLDRQIFTCQTITEQYIVFSF